MSGADECQTKMMFDDHGQERQQQEQEQQEQQQQEQQQQEQQPPSLSQRQHNVFLGAGDVEPKQEQEESRPYYKLQLRYSRKIHHQSEKLYQATTAMNKITGY